MLAWSGCSASFRRRTFAFGLRIENGGYNSIVHDAVRQRARTPFREDVWRALAEGIRFVPGTFDDCQDLVKAVNADAGFKATYRIGAVNSINWARVLAQAVYYFRAYLTLNLPEGAFTSTTSSSW